MPDLPRPSFTRVFPRILDRPRPQSSTQTPAACRRDGGRYQKTPSGSIARAPPSQQMGKPVGAPSDPLARPFAPEPILNRRI